MESFISKVIDAVKEDIAYFIGKREEKGIYRYILPCNPKPYSISSFQHFFDTFSLVKRRCGVA